MHNLDVCLGDQEDNPDNLPLTALPKSLLFVLGIIVGSFTASYLTAIE